MKKKVYSVVVFLSLATPALAVAEDNNTTVHGTIDMGVQASSLNGDKARFQEFRPMDDAVLGNIQLDALKDAYYFQFDAATSGADDQSFQLKGGEYENFKYKFNYNEMVHNYLFDAITPYTGLGTQHVDPVATKTNPATWTKFDYSVEHKTYGGEVEVSMHSPYFVKFGVDRHEQTGLRPLGNYHSLLAEVPEPISNSTDNLHLQAGYRGESLTTSVTGILSSFNNDNHYMSTLTPDTVDDYVTFAPDNNYKKLSGDLALRDLPLSSVLSAAATYSNLENSYSLSDLNLNASNLSAADWAAVKDTPRFDGEVDYKSLSLALSSNPMDKLDTKLYYNYLDRKNKSTIINGNDGGLLSYNKDTAGIDLGYRLPEKTKLTAGYEYLKMDRSTPAGGTDVPNGSTKDNSEYVQLKNSSLDWVTAKLRYKHVSSKSDHGDVDPAILVAIPLNFQNHKSDEWKLGFDLSPMDRLDLGLDYTYKKTDYDNTVQSRTGDTRQNVYLDATWHVIGKATLSGSVGHETVKTENNGIDDPQDYTQKTDDHFWSYGLVANVPGLLDDKLTLNLSWQYQKSDGEIDFGNDTTGNNLQNITQSDDYTKKTLQAKAIYAINRNLGLTVGYLYEKLEYSDIAYQNYSNYYVFDATHSGYFSGLNANPNYEANIGYLMLKYGF